MATRLHRGPSVVTALDRQRRRQALGALAVALCAVLAFLGLIALYLWLSWQRVYWADQVTEARVQQEQLHIEQRYLQAERAKAFSLERVAAFAKAAGMIEPQLRYWPPDKP